MTIISLSTVQVRHPRTFTFSTPSDIQLYTATGQIELYTHHPFLPTLVKNLQRLSIRTCAVYLIDSQFMEDKYKFFRFAIALIFFRFQRICDYCNSGVLSAMSAMVNLEIPWINIMSKMDLVTSNPEHNTSARIGPRKRKDIAR